MDKLKAMFSGKKGKYFLLIAGVVVVIAVFALRSRTRYASDVGMTVGEYPAYTAGGSGGGSSGTDTTGVIVDQFKDALETQSKQNKDAMDKQAQQYDKLMEQQTGQFADIFNQYASSTQSQIDLLNKEWLAKLADLSNQKASSLPSINYADSGVYGVANPFTGNASTGVAQPMYGYGGVNYNAATTEQKRAMEANQKRLDNDPAFVQSEIERTNKVIADRKAAGLDTTSQEKYLKVQLKAG